MDARQIQVYRGAMLLLAHSGIDHRCIAEADIGLAVTLAHKTLGVVEENVKPFGPVSKPVQLDTAA